MLSRKILRCFPLYEQNTDQINGKAVSVNHFGTNILQSEIHQVFIS